MEQRKPIVVAIRDLESQTKAQSVQLEAQSVQLEAQSVQLEAQSVQIKELQLAMSMFAEVSGKQQSNIRNLIALLDKSNEN
jgi:hypothetical protein